LLAKSLEIHKTFFKTKTKTLYFVLEAPRDQDFKSRGLHRWTYAGRIYGPTPLRVWEYSRRSHKL